MKLQTNGSDLSLRELPLHGSNPIAVKLFKSIEESHIKYSTPLKSSNFDNRYLRNIELLFATYGRKFNLISAEILDNKCVNATSSTTRIRDNSYVDFKINKICPISDNSKLEVYVNKSKNNSNNELALWSYSKFHKKNFPFIQVPTNEGFIKHSIWIDHRSHIL